MILTASDTKMKVNYDPLYSNFMLFDYMENIPGNVPHISAL